MLDKIVVLIGAGFSVPADIPIQNKILSEMTKPLNDFINMDEDDQDLDSDNFLDAYIRVSLYLLNTYGDPSNIKTEDLYNKFLYTLKQEEHEKHLEYLESKIGTNNISEEQEQIRRFLEENKPKQEKYAGEKILIKAMLENELKKQNIQVSLEDIFTTFDKSLKEKKHSKSYTYHEEDITQQSILRLFVYYFGKKLKKHSYNNEEYLNFLNFINKNNVSIITTNWDTLIEGYFERSNMNYDLCLNNEYFKYDDITDIKENIKNIKLIKLHGSINWFNCLTCGKTSIIKKENCGEYLLQNNKKEKCICCETENKFNFPLLCPEIITPTMVKNYGNQLYKNLWSAAAEELRKANKIIFIGYSMPAADFEIKYLLQNSIEVTTQIEVILHKNDNPDELTENVKYMNDLLPKKRYEDTFVHNKINFYYRGFGDYFRE